MTFVRSFLVALVVLLAGCGIAATASDVHPAPAVPAADVRVAHFQRLGMF